MGISKLLKSQTRAVGLLAFMLLWAVAGVGQDTILLSPNAPVQYQQYSPRHGAEENDTAGSALGVRNYIAPVFRFTEIADSNPQLTSQQSGVEAASIVSGDLALHHLWRHAMLNMLYQGGASFYSNSSQMNTWYQKLGFEQTFVGRRSTFSFGNHFSYLPESAFGFSGLGFPSYPGMQPSYGSDLITPPLQSVLTPYATQYGNTTDGQWQYKLTARSTVSFSGSYGLLRFSDSGFFNTNSYGAGASYSHQIGRNSSLGISYGASLIRYSEVTTEIDSHSAELEFKHTIHKRFALQMGAGPQYVVYNFGGTEQRSIYPTGHLGVTSHWGRTDLGLMYAKAVTTGSGVMQGAKTDVASFTAGRKLSRHWHGSANFSYAHNSSLQPNGAVTYDTEALGASLDRSIGRTVSVFFQYSLQNQSSNAASSALTSNFLRHTFGVGFSWSPRNIPVN